MQLNTRILDGWGVMHLVDSTENITSIAKLVKGSTVRRSLVICICISAKETRYLMALASTFT